MSIEAKYIKDSIHNQLNELAIADIMGSYSQSPMILLMELSNPMILPITGSDYQVKTTCTLCAGSEIRTKPWSRKPCECPTNIFQVELSGNITKYGHDGTLRCGCYFDPETNEPSDNLDAQIWYGCDKHYGGPGHEMPSDPEYLHCGSALKQIIQFGTIPLTAIRFPGSFGLTGVSGVELPPSVTDTSYMFADCSRSNFDIKLNTQNVTNMHGMFSRAGFWSSSITLDMGRVKDASYMFANSSFSGNLIINGTHELEDTRYMFANINHMEPITNNLSKLSMGKVAHADFMCSMANMYENPEPLNWDTSSLITWDKIFGGPYPSMGNLAKSNSVLIEKLKEKDPTQICI